MATAHQLDIELLDRVDRAEPFVLAAVALIAAVVLCGWMAPAVGKVLPVGWSLMKANTALAALLCAASLALTWKKHRAGLVLAGRLSAGGAVVLAFAALLEHWSGYGAGLSTLLAADTASPMPGLMSIQTATTYLLLGLCLVIDPARQDALGNVLDFLSTLLLLIIFILVVGYVYDAAALVGQSEHIRTSLQTLACLALLTFVQVSRRASWGLFSVYVGVGMGSHFARVMTLSSVAATIVTTYIGAELLDAGKLSLPYAAAVIASAMVVVLIFVIMYLARKINVLESNLRKSSLTDELTGLNNLRGFHLLGEQMMRDAQRNEKAVSVLFFDADGLKQINDNLGHEMGSAFLRDIASLLRSVFRDNDILGRVGGDEFAVVVQGSQADFASVLRRFDNVVEAQNQSGGKPYRMSCSVGAVSAEPGDGQTLTDLLARADEEMYKNKRQRRARREDGGVR